MQTKLFILILLIAAFGQAQDSNILLKKANTFPEGLVYSKKFKTVYTGSMMTGELFSATKGTRRLNDLPIENASKNIPALGMKEENGNLYVATGSNGTIEVFDIPTQKKVNAYSVPNGLSKDKVFINDVAIDGKNQGYVTDSFRPVIYSFVPHSENTELAVWLDLENTGIQFEEGYNLNGIVLTKKAKYLLVIQTNTGKLYRINTTTKETTEVRLTGESLLYGDGLSIRKKKLYVALNVSGAVAKVALNDDFSAGTVTTVKKGFQFPTAVAVTSKKLYVLNSQLDKSGGENEVGEFKISVLSEF